MIRWKQNVLRVSFCSNSKEILSSFKLKKLPKLTCVSCRCFLFASFFMCLYSLDEILHKHINRPCAHELLLTTLSFTIFMRVLWEITLLYFSHCFTYIRRWLLLLVKLDWFLYSNIVFYDRHLNKTIWRDQQHWNLVISTSKLALIGFLRIFVSSNVFQIIFSSALMIHRFSYEMIKETTNVTACIIRKAFAIIDSWWLNIWKNCSWHETHSMM